MNFLSSPQDDRAAIVGLRGMSPLCVSSATIFPRMSLDDEGVGKYSSVVTSWRIFGRLTLT